MNFSIIPDYNHLEESYAISKEYGVNFEYNDFIHSEVYDNLDEINKRIDIYKSSGRDLTNDTMHGAFLGLDLAAEDPVLRNRSRQLMRQSMDIADQMGIRGVVFHTGLIGELRLDYYINNWLAEAEIFYRELATNYPRQTIFLENSFEQEPDCFEKLMKKMSDVHNFKLCFDYAHAVLTLTSVDDWIEKLAPYIGHMHVNDNDLKDDLHQVPGTGSIDFNHWKKLCDSYHLDVSVLLELKGIDNQLQALNFMKSIF